MIEIGPNWKSMLRQRVHELAYLWRIERTDGTILRFTTHNAQLTYAGETYAPKATPSGSATQLQAGLKEQNMSVEGIVNSDDITDQDLRNGLYREAKVTQMLINWRSPWAGPVHTMDYWIVDVTWSVDRWEARLEGLSTWLKRPTGNVYSRNCRYTLGDSDCKVNIAALTQTGTVATVTDALLSFTSDLSEADNYFRYGLLTWLTGNNSGVAIDVGSFVSNEFAVQLKQRFEIQVGDTFTVYPGCDKTIEACKGTDGTTPWPNNIVNHGGFPTIPGQDKLLTTPNFK